MQKIICCFLMLSILTACLNKGQPSQFSSSSSVPDSDSHNIETTNFYESDNYTSTNEDLQSSSINTNNEQISSTCSIPEHESQSVDQQPLEDTEDYTKELLTKKEKDILRNIPAYLYAYLDENAAHDNYLGSSIEQETFWIYAKEPVNLKEDMETYIRKRMQQLSKDPIDVEKLIKLIKVNYISVKCSQTDFEQLKKDIEQLAAAKEQADNLYMFIIPRKEPPYFVIQWRDHAVPQEIVDYVNTSNLREYILVETMPVIPAT